jgi:phosphoglycerate dehydrogenase-like enzyme
MQMLDADRVDALCGRQCAFAVYALPGETELHFCMAEDGRTESDFIFCCLNKNTVLLHDEEFAVMEGKKVLFNTGLSPAWEEAPMLGWLERNPKNRLYCDTLGALGGEGLMAHPQVRTVNVSTGRTKQAFDRLSEKVLHNIKQFLEGAQC